MLTSLRLRNRTHSHTNPSHLTLSGGNWKLKGLNLKSFQAEHFRLESCYDISTKIVWSRIRLSLWQQIFGWKYLANNADIDKRKILSLFEFWEGIEYKLQWDYSNQANSLAGSPVLLMRRYNSNLSKIGLVVDVNFPHTNKTFWDISCLIFGFWIWEQTNFLGTWFSYPEKG